jgi:hypothetical protein
MSGRSDMFFCVIPKEPYFGDGGNPGQPPVVLTLLRYVYPEPSRRARNVIETMEVRRANFKLGCLLRFHRKTKNLFTITLERDSIIGEAFDAMWE